MHRVLIALLVVVSSALAGHAIAATTGHTVVATEQSATEICFPARLWGGPGSTASPEDRPCITVNRPQEDGSGALTLGTVGADAAVCTIPNPYEERQRFTIRCHRVPNR